MTYKDFLAIDTFIEKNELLYILQFVTNSTSAKIYCSLNSILNADMIRQLSCFLKSREAGIPFAYLVNKKDFYDISLFVDNHCLIPRCDTEILIDFILEKYSNTETLSLLDLGTGSGCIGLTLAKHRPNWSITLSDICPKALDIAKRNAYNLSLYPIFILSDWLKNIVGNFDIIVSNPPYISLNDIRSKETDYEPHISLFSNKNGLEDLEHIIVHSKNRIDKCIILEHSNSQHITVAKIFKALGYNYITPIKDMSGNTRATVAYV